MAHSVHNGLTKAPGTHAMLHGEKVGAAAMIRKLIMNASG